MSEIIQPAAGQTVISTDRGSDWNRGYGRDDDGHEVIRDLERDIYRATVHNGEKVLLGFGDASRQVSEIETRGTEQFGDASRQVSEVETRALVEAAKNAAQLGVQAEKNTAQLGVQSDKNAAFGQIQAQTFASAASIEAAKYANAQSLQSLTFFNAASVEAAKYANAQTLQAQVLASTAAAQLAACCCELKEKVGDDGQKTRDLMNQIDRERGARELVNANSEILYLKSRLPAGTVV